MTLERLPILRKSLLKGQNIIRLLNPNHHNSIQSIEVSYDLQAGAYNRRAKENHEFIDRFTTEFADVINHFNTKLDIIFEAGVGEATTLVNLIPKIVNQPKRVFGCDLSWSRIKEGQRYSSEKGLDPFLFMGNFFDTPLADNSADIVYTALAIEPNGGREKEALSELMRITRKYLILVEPAFEYAEREARRRMKYHGYITKLYSTAHKLGLNIIEHRPFGISENPLNPVGLIVIEKNLNEQSPVGNPLICPISKKPLELIRGSYFSPDGLLAYPVIDGVPCLIRDKAIIATHY